MLRQINHFERAITLNIERLGVQLGCEGVKKELSRALADAQMDFLAIAARLRPFQERMSDLTSLANDIAGLRASFKSIQDGEQGLRLSLFAAVIFPLTLVASMLSMGEDFLPGKSSFWVFWAASVPLAIAIGFWLIYGNKIRGNNLERHARQEAQRRPPKLTKMKYWKERPKTTDSQA